MSHKGYCYLREIFDVSPIEPDMSQKPQLLTNVTDSSGVKLLITEIVSLSTSKPCFETLCPRTIPSVTM